MCANLEKVHPSFLPKGIPRSNQFIFHLFHLFHPGLSATRCFRSVLFSLLLTHKATASLPSIFLASFLGCMATRGQPAAQPRGDPARCMVKVSPSMFLVQLTKWAERGVPRPRGSTWAHYGLVRVLYPIGPAEDTVGSLHLLGRSLWGSRRHKGGWPQEDLRALWLRTLWLRGPVDLWALGWGPLIREPSQGAHLSR